MERDIRILLVDDSPDGAYLIEHQLNNSGLSFRMTVVREENEFRNALEQFQPGVILCDHSLPAFNSIEALDIAKEFERKKNIFCVRLYGSFQDIHERKQEEALKNAYVEKTMILESIGDAFFAVDKQRTATY